MTAPYIAMTGVPAVATRADVSRRATSVIDSSVLDSLPKCNSPDFSQGMLPPKYSGFERLGVPPANVLAMSFTRRVRHSRSADIPKLLQEAHHFDFGSIALRPQFKELLNLL